MLQNNLTQTYNALMIKQDNYNFAIITCTKDILRAEDITRKANVI